MEKFKYTFLLMVCAALFLKAQDLVVPEPPDIFFKINEKTEKEYLKNISSELKFKLQEIKEFNKGEYFELLNELQFSNMGQNLFSQKEKSFHEMEQKILKYEIETKSLLAKLNKTDDKDKDKLKEELKQSVSTLFDLKEKRRGLEIKRLEERLQELNKKLRIRSKNKDEIIKRRLQELLEEAGEENYLEWE